MTKTAMEKEIDDLIINRLQYSRGHRVIGIQSTLLRDDIMDYVYSQLSQIKEEIVKEHKINSNTDTYWFNRGLDKAINIITSHMEEKGQKEK